VYLNINLYAVFECTNFIHSNRNKDDLKLINKGAFGRSGSLKAMSLFDHKLHGSASPVLTTTGFVNGQGLFSTP